MTISRGQCQCRGASRSPCRRPGEILASARRCANMSTGETPDRLWLDLGEPPSRTSRGLFMSIEIETRIEGLQALIRLNRSMRCWRFLTVRSDRGAAPFTNLSGDPEQDYLAGRDRRRHHHRASRVRWLFVIARNSSFSCKGKPECETGRARTGRSLCYLEGSIRKAATAKIRITGQFLIEADTDRRSGGSHDRTLDDVFCDPGRTYHEVWSPAIEPSLPVWRKSNG